MAHYRILLDDELQDEVFDTEEDAEEYALYLVSCTRTIGTRRTFSRADSTDTTNKCA